MNQPDDNNSDLANAQIERERRLVFGGGGLSQKIGDHDPRDPRFSGLIKWVWAALGALALLIGQGMYSKLSSINDTLIQVVSDLKNQGNQVSELKSEVRDLRASQVSLQRQVDSLEGKTLRGIEEIRRGP